MSLPNLLALGVIFIAVPLNWFVTFRLWKLSLAEPRLRVLRERAILSTFMAVIVTVFGLLFLSNDLAQPLLNLDASRLLSRSVTLAVGIVPASYWLYLYR